MWGGCYAQADDVLGARPAIFSKVRMAARACLTDHTSGKSLTLDLAVRDGHTDPAYELNKAPLVQWARGAWRQSVPLGWMYRAFSAAQRAAGATRHAWTAVIGPAGATLATLEKLGWTARNATQWQNPQGEIDLCKDSPALVGRLADLSTARTL
jgi:hypothetical protein